MNKNIVILCSLIILGITTIMAGFLAGLKTSSQIAWDSDHFVTPTIMLPSSEKTIEMNVYSNLSVIQVLSTSNTTLTIDLLHDGYSEFGWKATDIKQNVQITEIGNWTVRIRNNSTVDYCECNSTVALYQSHMETKTPYLWLQIPLALLGVLLMVSTIPVYFSSRLRRINKETIKTIIVAAILILLFFSYQIGEFILNTSYPWMVCEGSSMQPTMYSGDLAIVQGANPQELSVGDIIVFDRANIYTNTDQSSTLVTPIAHRIQYSFSRNGTMLFGTKGDNNQAYDDWVVPDYGVVGKVTLIIPKVGYIWLFLERLDVRITIITIILFIAFAWPLISRKRKTSTSIKRKEEPNLTQNQKIHNKKDGSFLNHLVPAFLINQTP